MKLLPETLTLIKENDLTIDQYFILWCKYHKNSWLLKYKPKKEDYVTLSEKEFLTTTMLISSKGRKLIETEMSGLHSLVTDMEKFEIKFEKFWKTFPVGDEVNHFMRTRTMKCSKAEATRLLLKRIKEGITMDTIITHLENEVGQRKATSIRENKLTYMKNMDKWIAKTNFDV